MRDLKAYREKLDVLLTEANNILNDAAEQTRAMTADEESAYNAKNKEYEDLKRTYDLLVKQHNITPLEINNTDPELKDFENFIRSKGEIKTRAMTSNNNGVLVPKTILNRVVEKAVAISPLASRVEKYYSKGDLVFPQMGLTGLEIEFKYVAEGDPVPEFDENFGGVNLKNNMMSLIVRVSDQMLSDTEFDVIGYIVKRLARIVSLFVEYFLIHGATNTKDAKVSTGAIEADNQLTTASVGKIEADDIIDLVSSIPQVYRKNAMIILNPDAMKKIRKLKNNSGDYLLVDNNAKINMPTIMGIEAWESVNIPATHVGIIIEPSGMAWKISRDFRIKTLNEAYAKYNQVGIMSSIHMDTGITDQDKIGVLKYKTA